MSRTLELLELALAEPEEQRRTFVERVAQGDAELCAEVLALLGAGDEAESYFESLAGQLRAGGAEEVAAAAGPTLSVGPWRGLALLGHGGMGSVYLAERADGQFERRVALKLIALGRESDTAVRRFLEERRIAARLDHPGIARLLDGGVAEDGRPFAAFEYVEGDTITRYAEAHAHSVEDRLRLFLQVADAVAYAHANLVVHRDLKPGNILVTPAGQAKLLDFGIAKLLDDTGDGATALTGTRERVLTPLYAAPEQLRGQAVTTAVDVYALGVLLFELLAGRRPFELEGRSLGELERAVTEQEPPLASALAPAARRRRLAGDLDTICAMALAKEPHRRHASAERLADDVRRHLAGRPVLARPATWRYRTSRFVLRNRLGVAVALLALLALSGAVAALVVQSARLARERDKAERVAALLIDVFAVADPSETRGATVTVREVLDRGAERVESGLEREPELRADLLRVLWRVYQNLGLYERASPLAQRALELRQRALGPRSAEAAELQAALGELLRLRGRFPEAERELREAIAIDLGRARPGSALARAQNDLGKVLQATGRLDEAQALLEEALARNRAAGQKGEGDAAENLNNLAAVHFMRGELDGAEARFREALALRRQRLGDDHPAVAASLSNLATVLTRKGDLGAAEPVQREALALHRRLFGEAHPRVATVLNNLALVLYQKGDAAGAEPLFREAIAMRRKLLGPRHPELAQSLSNLGLLLQEQGRLDEPAALYAEALAIREQALGPAHMRVAQTLNNIGLLHQARHEYTAADRDLQRALAMLRAAFGEQHPLVAEAVHNLAGLEAARGRLGPARALYEQALATRRGLYPQGHAETALTLLALGRLHLQSGDASVAEPLLREALELRQRLLPAGHAGVAEARVALQKCGVGEV